MKDDIQHRVPHVDLRLDPDPQETAEWRDAFQALVTTQGHERARFVLDELARLARNQRTGWQPDLNTPYVNTIAVDQQPVFPGDLAIEERLASLMRWNALAMVVRANQVDMGGSSELGGHIASYASAADLFETGFNHFFHAHEGMGEANVVASDQLLAVDGFGQGQGLTRQVLGGGPVLPN